MEELEQRLAFFEEALGDEARARVAARERAEQERAEQERLEIEAAAERARNAAHWKREAAKEQKRLERRDELMAEAERLLEQLRAVGVEVSDLAQESVMAAGRQTWIGRDMKPEAMAVAFASLHREGWPPFAGPAWIPGYQPTEEQRCVAPLLGMTP
jgi:hypothetical protein